jgi:Spy/CpxP family protein refolding chaperone
MAALFMASLESIVLKPEQKTAIEAIEADLEKLRDASLQPRAKLERDVADGVTAGKLDHKKTDADVAALSTSAAATVPSMQDAMNRLHKTLDVDQRKKLIETMRAKGKEMRAHMGMGEHGMGEHGMGEHGMGMAEHAGKGPGEHGMGMAEHGGKGPGGHDHAAKGPGGAEHPGMSEGPLMMLGAELALTPEQKEQLHAKLETQMKANHAAMKAKMEAAEQHLDAIGSAFEGEKFDAKKVGVGAEAAEMVKARASARVQFVELLLTVLTPEQRTKFAAHLREHADDAAEGD